ncbi:MAG: Flp pilus assembly protein CpaB [Candidatus Melainabacteria bacterium HGW-Melainabacteria-1]|nr:MAG: Flp pilus assembly protein CpaB [Candidatus Melainabacteria bacterium HGW-Melainabacteria-1]
MASMDNLRDKIRSRRADTSELDAAPIPAPVTAQPYDEAPVSHSNTDSLISEIFADQPTQPVFGTAQSAPEPKPKKALNLPFLNRFKQLEINRKMLIVSLSVAAVASFLSVAYLKGIAEPLRGQAQMVKVITLTKDVPARTELTEVMLTIREVPKAYVPEGALAYQPNMKLLGQVTTASLYKGEILHSERISLPNEDTGISTVIPAAHRAMTIRTANAGLINPSSHDRKEYVDVIATIPDPNPVRQGKLITYPILQRAMVLAVGNRMSESESGASAIPSNTISLAVPEDRVRLMVTLLKKGEFEVIPRGPADESVQPEEYTVQEIMDALQGKFEATPAVASAKPEPAAIKLEDPPVPAAPLVDLSGGTPTYRAPARAPARAPVYRAPARAPVYRAPVRTAPRAPARAPARAAAPPPRAAAPAYSKPRTQMPRMTIQGGNVTQSN